MAREYVISVVGGLLWTAQHENSCGFRVIRVLGWSAAIKTTPLHATAYLILTRGRK